MLFCGHPENKRERTTRKRMYFMRTIMMSAYLTLEEKYRQAQKYKKIMMQPRKWRNEIQKPQIWVELHCIVK
jgi:hypothetical protein